MDVRMPDGTIVTNVPDTMTKAEFSELYNKHMAAAPQEVPPNPEQTAPVGEASAPVAAPEDGLLTRMGDAAMGLFGKSKYQDVSKVPMQDRNWFEQQVGMIGTGLEIGAKNTKSAVLNNQIAGIVEVQEARKSQYGSVENMPEDVREKYIKDQKAIESKLKETGDISAEVSKLRQAEGRTSTQNFFQLQQTPEYKNADFWDKTKMVGGALMEDPLGIITDLGLESLPASLAVAAPALLVGVATRNPEAAAITGGAASAMTEFGNQYVDLRAQGMPHGEAWEKAGVKSGVIGLFDGLSFRSAGKAASAVVREIETGAKEGLLQGTKEILKETGKQAAYGGAGEALGATAIGEAVDPGQVLAEAVGEVFGAPGEAISTYRSQQQETALRKALLGEEPAVPQVEVIGQPGVQAPAEERIEPTFAGPIEEAPAPEVSPEQELYDAEFLRFRQLGFNETLAAEQAAAAVKEAQDAGELAEPTARAVEPSIPVPTEQGRAEPGVEETPSEGLGVDTTGVQGADVRQGEEQRALEESSTGLAKLGGAAKAITGNMYATLFDALQQGKTIVAGVKDPVLARAKTAFDAGLIKSPEDLQRFENEGYPVTETPALEQAPTPEEDRATQLYMMKTNQIIGVLQSAAEGNTIAQQEYAETGRAPTDKKVRKYLMDYFTPLLGKKDAKRYTDFLVDEGGLDSGDYGMGHELFDMALNKIPVIGAATTKPTTTEAPAPTTEAPAPTTEAPTTEAPTPTPTTEAPVVTKGKRGRPAKTAEEKALTAERAAQRKLERKESGRTKLLNDARYKLNNAITYIQTPDVNADIFPKTPEGQAALQTARNELQAKQVTGAKDIYKIAHDPALKGTPNQKKAMGLWEKFTPQEKRAVEAMVKEEAIGPSRAEIGAATESGLVESTDGRENGAYLTLNNPSQALAYIRKTGNEFEKALAQRIAPFLQGTKLVIVHDMTDVPKNVRAKFKGAVGMYDNVTRTIYLSAEGGLNNTVFLHEAVHGATIARINQFIKARNAGTPIPKNIALAMQELESLMQRSKNFYSILKASPDTLTADQKRIVDNMDEFLRVEAFDDVKEFVAYGFTHPAFQQFLYILPGRIKGEAITKANGFSRFVDSVRRILGMDEKHDSALQDLIAITDTLIGDPSFKGPDVSNVSDTLMAKARARQKKASKNEEKLIRSWEATNIPSGLEDIATIAKEGHNFKDYQQLFDDWLDAGKDEFIAKLVSKLSTADLIRWKGDTIAGLYEIDSLQQKRASMEQHLKVGATKKAEVLGAFVRKNGQRTISEAMHLARLNSFSPQIGVKLEDAIKADPVVKHYDARLAKETDPAKAKGLKSKRSKRINEITAVYAKWDALGKQKNGQEVYVMVRDFYRDNYTASRRILNEQLEALPIDDDAKARLMKSVRLMYEQAKEADTEDYETGEGETIKMPRPAEDYFPFRRYGKYWLEVKGSGDREFYTFESGKARNRMQTKRAKALGESNDSNIFDMGNDLAALRNKVQDSSMMLQKMFADIENMKPSKQELAQDPKAFDAYKEELKDQLYQTYLMTLPERSFRKQFLHAEKVTGFSADIFRNFKVTSTMYATQLANLKYGMPIEEQIQRARDYSEGKPARERKTEEIFINEIAFRAREELHPTKENAFVTAATQFSYYWLLTSVASAATQFFSIPQVVLPTLSSTYGTAQTAATLKKYLPFWNSIGVKDTSVIGETVWVPPSFGVAARVKNNPLLKAAFDAALDRHVTTITNTSVLTDQGATPEHVAGSKLRMVTGSLGYTARAMGALFNTSERMTREMTYLMAFELEYAKNGGNFGAAVDKAVDVTYDTLGRYDKFNRPRIMRGLAKLPTQFMQFPYNMSSFLVRNFYNMSRLDKSLTAPERKQAMKTFVGTLTMGMMVGGIRSLPALSVMFLLYDLILSAIEGDDDEDKQNRRFKTPLFANDSKHRFFYEWLPEHFGNITVPGLDGRDHSLDDIMARGPLSVLTDIDFGSRTGYDNMWFKNPTLQPTMEGTLATWMEDILGGASGSAAKNFVRGLEDMAKGDIMKGMEGVLPAALRTPVSAARMEKEGVVTRGGNQILDREELNAMNIVAKGLGFSSTRVAQAQEAAFKWNAAKREADAKRTEVLRNLDRAVIDDNKTDKDIDDALADIEKFNNRYPNKKYHIDAETINDSLKTYAEHKGKTYRGIYLDDKLLPYIVPYLEGTSFAE